MNTLESLQWRYATQLFDESKIIPEEKVEIIKKAFNLTPTSYGMQPVKMVVVKNKEIQKDLFELTYYQKQISTASHLLIFCTKTVIDTAFIEDSFQLEKEIRNTPDEIINKSKEFRIGLFSSWSEIQKEQWAVNQLYLTLGNVLNVCAQEKIDACPMEGFKRGKYDEYLKLKEKNLKSHLVVPIGYRSKDDFFADFKKVRRPLEEMVLVIN